MFFESASKVSPGFHHDSCESATDFGGGPKKLEMMGYKKLRDQDLVIASGIIEGAARYVVGERMDCSGMRWIDV